MMKKRYTSMVAIMLALSLTACGQTGVQEDDPSTQDTQITEQQPDTDNRTDMDGQTEEETGQIDDTANQDSLTADENQQNQGQGVSEDATVAQILKEDFLDKMDGGQITGTTDLANALVANPIIPFSPATAPVEPGFLTGFTEEISGFSEGAMFGPMIGSIPFVGYVFVVDGDVEQFMNQLKEKSDMRWNICTEADETVCEAHGNTVLFIMSPATFEQ